MSTTTHRGHGGVPFAEAVRLVAGREVFVKLRDKGFLISTAVTLLIIVAAFVAPALLSGGSDDYDLAVVGDGADAVGTVLEQPDGPAAAEDVTVTPVVAPDAATAEALVTGGEADAALLSTGSGARAQFELVVENEVPAGLRRAVAATVSTTVGSARLVEAGVTQAEVAALLTPPEVAERFLDPEADQAVQAQLLGVGFAVLFFFTALTYGLTIAQSVTEEKQNRVVELLVAMVPVRALLVGKVLGNVVLAVGQLVLLLAAAFLAASVVGQGDLLPLLAGSTGWFVAFFLLGFAMLACVWAATGAMAARVEDLGSTTLPVQMLVMLPFFAAVAVQPGTLRDVLSFVPFTAPVVMPQRLVAGDASWWEGLLALGSVAVTAAVLVVLAERLYRTSLLRTRTTKGLREAFASTE
ncbi:ABC transporter permease [Aquipuribacter sp. MA13-6]|uniref:ABC transporter permease n=1 Tax=unclassified Aquipuribacter TaxID=2635084 RepID=UPI003EEA5A27